MSIVFDYNTANFLKKIIKLSYKTKAFRVNTDKNYGMKKHDGFVQEIIKDACVGKYTKRQASEYTGLSIAQIGVLKRQYRKIGNAAFVHGNTGRKPSTTIPDKIKQEIVIYYKKEFVGYNFTFFKKYLHEIKDMHISYKSVYKILTVAGIASPEKRKVPKEKAAHRHSFRREHEGELMQSDASFYDWFGTGDKFCLHGGIDDATNQITGLYMCENECIYGYGEVMRQTACRNGIPCAMYTDRHAIFCVTPKNKDKLTLQEQIDGLHEKRTQWQDILSELNIEQILAHSPQAKGRVERLWRTLKGRLPWYFKWHGIKTIEQANVFLQSFVDIYNREFAREPAKETSFYRQAPKNIDDILCVKIPRKTDVSGVFTLHGYRFRFSARYAARKNITIYISEKDGIRALCDGVFYPVEFMDTIQNCVDDTMPKVLENIIYKYFYKSTKLIA